MRRLKPVPGKPAPEASLTAALGRPFAAQSLCKYFPTLAAAQLQQMAAAISLKRCKRGDRVLSNLEARTESLLVLTGAIAVTWQQGRDDPVLVTLLAPGEMFGVAASAPPELAQGL